MQSLFLRIWLTVVAVLALFALGAGLVAQQAVERERSRLEAVVQERLAAWADLLERSLPPASADPQEQSQALQEWSQRLRVPLALDDAQGRRVAASESFLRRGGDAATARVHIARFDDGRTLRLLRLAGPMRGRTPGMMGPMGPRASGEPMDGPMDAPGVRPPAGPVGGMPPVWWLGRVLPEGAAWLTVLGLVFFGVAASAWPVVRRLTRRLEALKLGVEAFGQGQLQQRVPEDGRDEVAAVAASFNRAASRIEALLRSHQSLLANASHELRSPLARLKMALSLLEGAGGEQRAALRREIDTNIAELDALVEEVLLASRLDAAQVLESREPVDLLALAAEEASRVDAAVHGVPRQVHGDERLLRRALRNLLENARRYGGAEVEVELRSVPGAVEVRVGDRGPGVPEAFRERIFEPFFRLPGHAERAGGVGLGLSLVRQIAERHQGGVRCEPREGGGSCFVLTLPSPPSVPSASS